MTHFGEYTFPASQKAAWKAGHLHREWATAYPQLFDADDLRQAQTQGPLGYHFIEWLAAITLHAITGYHALVSKYEFSNHPRKAQVLERVLRPDQVAFLRSRTSRRRVQCPDLLMYAEDFADWFFCEAKGPGDRVRPAQARYFEELQTLTGRPVYAIRFRQLDS